MQNCFVPSSTMTDVCENKGFARNTWFQDIEPSSRISKLKINPFYANSRQVFTKPSSAALTFQIIIFSKYFR